MKFLIFTVSLLFCFSAFAEVDQQSLLKTQDLLKDTSKTNSHINASSPQAQQAMQMLRGMGMTKEQETQLMGIAADAFGGMMNGANGDTSKLKDQLAKGMSDPKAFLNSMSSNSKNRLRDLSSQIEGMNTNERK